MRAGHRRKTRERDRQAAILAFGERCEVDQQAAGIVEDAEVLPTAPAAAELEAGYGVDGERRVQPGFKHCTIEPRFVVAVAAFQPQFFEDLHDMRIWFALVFCDAPRGTEGIGAAEALALLPAVRGPGPQALAGVEGTASPRRGSAFSSRCGPQRGPDLN